MSIPIILVTILTIMVTILTTLMTIQAILMTIWTSLAMSKVNYIDLTCRTVTE